MKTEFETMFNEFCSAKNAIIESMPSYSKTGFIFNFATNTHYFTISCGTFEVRINAVFSHINGKWECVEKGGYAYEGRIEEMMKIIIEHFGE
jgi:hypothetical protein